MKKWLYWVAPLLIIPLAITLNWITGKYLWLSGHYLFWFLGLFLLSFSFYKIVKNEIISKSFLHGFLYTLLTTVSVFLSFIISLIISLMMSPLDGDMAGLGIMLMIFYLPIFAFFGSALLYLIIIIIKKPIRELNERRGRSGKKNMLFENLWMSLVFLLSFIILTNLQSFFRHIASEWSGWWFRGIIVEGINLFSVIFLIFLFLSYILGFFFGKIQNKNRSKIKIIILILLVLFLILALGSGIWVNLETNFVTGSLGSILVKVFLASLIACGFFFVFFMRAKDISSEQSAVF